MFSRCRSERLGQLLTALAKHILIKSLMMTMDMTMAPYFIIMLVLIVIMIIVIENDDDLSLNSSSRFSSMCCQQGIMDHYTDLSQQQVPNRHNCKAHNHNDNYSENDYDDIKRSMSIAPQDSEACAVNKGSSPTLIKHNIKFPMDLFKKHIYII